MRHAKQGSLPGAMSVSRPAQEPHAFGQVQPGSHRLQDGTGPAMQQGTRLQHSSLPPPQHALRQAPARVSPGVQNRGLPDMQPGRALQHPLPHPSRDRQQQVPTTVACTAAYIYNPCNYTIIKSTIYDHVKNCSPTFFSSSPPPPSLSTTPLPSQCVQQQELSTVSSFPLLHLSGLHSNGYPELLQVHNHKPQYNAECQEISAASEPPAMRPELSWPGEHRQA